MYAIKLQETWLWVPIGLNFDLIRCWDKSLTASFLSVFLSHHIMTASPTLYHYCQPFLFGIFVPSDKNITSPWLQKISVMPSSRKYWRQTSSRLPIKPLSIAGAEVGWMLEYLSPTPNASLSNLVRLAWCSNSSLVSRRVAPMATMYGYCVSSFSSAFPTGRNTGSLVGIERDRCFDTTILRCDASSSRVKDFPLLDRCVLRSSQPKHITLILIFYFKASILYELLFIFFISLSTTAAVFQQASE